MLFYVIFAVFLAIPLNTSASATFAPNPETAYARTFISRSQNQSWFLDYVESILNSKGRSINTLESAADLSGIYAIGLANAEINGMIPGSIGDLSDLQYIFLSGNNLAGPIPSSLFTLTNLRNLDLSDNRLTATLSPNISNLTELEVLLLHNNNLHGTIPTSLWNKPNLINVDLANNNFSGSFPSDMSGMTSLRFLSVSNNDFSGLLPNFSSLESLQALLIHGNTFTGVITNQLPNVGEIRLLDLSYNALVGDIDIRTRSLINNGVTVDLFGNYMAGSRISQVPFEGDNFIDEVVTGQNRLLIVDTIGGFVNQPIELHQHLRTYCPVTLNILREQLRLPPSQFIIFTEDPVHAHKISWHYTEAGLFITALTTIPTNNPITVVIQIRENPNSEFSRTSFEFSAVVPSTTGSGGGGGGGAWGILGSHHANRAPAVEAPPVQEDDDRIRFISGYPDGTFRPNNPITREEFAQILSNIYNDGTTQVRNAPFTDVAGRWSLNAINFVYTVGFMQGFPDGSFKATNYLTRAEFATVLFNIEELTESRMSAFPDTVGHWAEYLINAVAEEGFMVGYPDGTFMPQNNITRAEVVVAMVRFLEIEPLTTPEAINVRNPFSDIDRSHWAFNYALAVVRPIVR